MSDTVATTITSLSPIPQQFPCLYDLYLQLLCYNNTYGWPISTALTLPDSTVSPTNTQALCYYNYYVSIIHIYSSYITRSYTVAITHTPLRPYITAITMSRYPIFTTLMLQWHILSQPLLLRPYNTATTMSTWSTFTALTSLWAILSPPLCLYNLYLQLLRYIVLVFSVFLAT